MYSTTHPDKGLIEYRDKKRYLWIASILVPLSPIFVIWGYYAFETAWVLVLPFVVSYGVVPVLDHLFGEDTSNPPEEIVPQLDADPYYKTLLKITIPLHFIVLAVSAWFVSAESFPLWIYLGFAMIVGMYSGFSINTAHEIGHKNSKADRLWEIITVIVSLS